MSITRYVEILKLGVPTAASGRIWPTAVVHNCLQQTTLPVYGMVGMPKSYADVHNLPAAARTHAFHDLYISGNSLYGEVEIFDSDLIDYVTGTEGTELEALFRVAALTAVSQNAFGVNEVTQMELKSINALPGERLLTGEP